MAIKQAIAADSQAKAANKQVEVAIEQANAAKEQTKLAITQFAANQKFLELTTKPHFSITQSANRESVLIASRLSIKNNGNGPAKHISCQYKTNNDVIQSDPSSLNDIVIGDSFGLIIEMQLASTGILLSYESILGKKYCTEFEWVLGQAKNIKEYEL